jgi:hypothetical protein
MYAIIGSVGHRKFTEMCLTDSKPDAIDLNDDASCER